MMNKVMEAELDKYFGSEEFAQLMDQLYAMRPMLVKMQQAEIRVLTDGSLHPDIINDFSIRFVDNVIDALQQEAFERSGGIGFGRRLPLSKKLVMATQMAIDNTMPKEIEDLIIRHESAIIESYATGMMIMWKQEHPQAVVAEG